MKRIGVAGIIRSKEKPNHILMGRRNKDDNRGLYVLPGGGVKENETLEQAFCREILEETNLKIEYNEYRWEKPLRIIELLDRIILVAFAWTDLNSEINLIDGDDLFAVEWFDCHQLPFDTSLIIKDLLLTLGMDFENKVYE